MSVLESSAKISPFLWFETKSRRSGRVLLERVSEFAAHC